MDSTCWGGKLFVFLWGVILFVMTSASAFSHDKCINIYKRTGGLMRLILMSVALILIGFFLIYHPKNTFAMVAGYSAMTLGVFTTIMSAVDIVRARRGYPAVRIYNDRIESFVPMKMKYQVLPFDDVTAFFVLDMYSVKVIRARLVNGKIRDTALQSSLVANLGDICQLLNERLAAYR